MTLLLDGEQVRGRNLKVTGNLRIESDDLSGQTSNSASAHKGFKPKSLTCTLMIRFDDSADLRALMRLVEATGSGGQPKLYRIVNDTATAFGIRQVHFSDGVSAREDDNLHAWMVQFTLSEYLSNPERVEKRRKPAGVSAQAAAGKSIGGTVVNEGDEKGQELSGFEQTLKKLDDWLA